VIRAAACLLLAATLAAPAAAACRQALLLALDVSGSVDAEEYRLQLDGLAFALEDPDVVQAFLAVPSAPVRVAVFEWSTATYQAVILDWTPVADAADLKAIAGQLRARMRRDAPESTGIAGALRFAETMFAGAPECWRQTLDLSADGQNNDWPAPERLLETGVLERATINVLAIRGPLPGAATPELGLTELVEYFRRKIIKGPGAFVEPASGYHDYARAMQRKLLRELSVTPVGQAAPEPPSARLAALQ
jgi:hypothetical protein